MSSYIPRVVDDAVTHALHIAGAVSLEGPRAVGKTETARQVAASELLLDDGSPRARLAREDPAAALTGQAPMLLDEWQLVDGLWNAVRREVDRRRTKGQFILTGSASPDDDPLRHSGAGRFLTITLRTMTLAETGHSTGAVSLAGLLRGELDGLHESEASLAAVVNRLVVGGWPGWADVAPADALELNRSWMHHLVERDYPGLAGTRRNPRLLAAYLRAVAPLVAQPASFAAIARRIGEGLAQEPAARTVAELHDFATRMYVLEDQPAWSPRLRSATQAAAAPVRHLADPSLVAACLDAGPDRLLAEPTTLGFIFESQVVHDLRVYAQAAGARGVFHYRDTKGRDELDAVVEAHDGSWIGVEVKLGQAAVDGAAANLIRVAAKVERPPAALVVVTPTGIAHRRRDGVFVVPLTVLGI